jgi:acyl-CoA synthetase (NDP forming)
VDDAAAREIERVVAGAHREGRDRLFEHEVYRLLRHAGGIEPPAHLFIAHGDPIDPAALARLPGDRVVLKLVSPEVAHKSDHGGVAFCARDADAVSREMSRMLDRHAHRSRVDGVLVVEHVDTDTHAPGGLGTELFVGLRETREFGPVLAAGLGGTDSEYLAGCLREDRAVARAPIADLTPESFLSAFRGTAAYELVSGRVRGHERAVSDEELVRCFAAFIDLAGRLPAQRQGRPGLTELEINPFTVRGQRLVPLDGRARLGEATRRPPPRPSAGVRSLLEPRSIAVLGVSGTNPKSFGRIILRNIIGAGFDPASVRVVKEGADRVEGVPCVPSISGLAEPVDLLVVAAGADQLPAIVDECVESRRVRSAVLIPGGAGETEGSEGIGRALAHAVARARLIPEGPVFVGPNSMGLQSRPGRFDTFFIPEEKLAKRWDAPHRGVALVSQSGAFLVRTLSAFESLDPAITISLGNQSDLTLSDLVGAIGERPDIHTIGVYAEGFGDLDGLDLCRSIASITARGGSVVLYKGGRTAAGRDAAAGHTASLAGDYDVCRDAAARAGAIVAEDFTAFSQILEVATMTRALPARGTRLGAVTNAGCESVSMGDQSGRPGTAWTLPELSDRTRAGLGDVLATHRLSGLVTPRNPLDLTPMAGERAYLDAARAMLEADEFDALVVSCVPPTPAVPSVAMELQAGSGLATGLAALRDEIGKPVVTAVDAGPRYEPFVAAFRDAGFPVIRSADDAIRVLGRVLSSRAHRPR